MSLVSIIIPYYKKKSYIQETIKSLVDQTFKNLEIIIIDDEVSKESFEILNKIKKIDERIKIFKNNNNKGAGLSRNFGIRSALGEYIAFCDCDDIWDKSKLEKQLRFMKNSIVEFSYTAYKIIDKEGNVIGKRNAKDQISFDKLKKSCDIGLSTVILKKEIIFKHNIFFPNLKTKEDFVLWLKLSEAGVKMYGINLDLSCWRKLNDSLSSSNIQKISDGYKVYKKHLKYNTFKSLLYLLILSINSILKK